MKRSDLSDYTMHRLRQRDDAREKERQERIDLIKSIAWGIGDVLAWVVLFIGIVAVAFADSESFVPGIVLGVCAVYLAIYGAFRGVLG